MIKLLWHVWHHGHGVTVNCNLTTSMYDVSARGWLYRCECGLVIAR